MVPMRTHAARPRSVAGPYRHRSFEVNRIRRQNRDPYSVSADYRPMYTAAIPIGALQSCGKRGPYPVYHSLSSHDDD